MHELNALTQLVDAHARASGTCTLVIQHVVDSPSITTGKLEVSCTVLSLHCLGLPHPTSWSFYPISHPNPPHYTSHDPTPKGPLSTAPYTMHPAPYQPSPTRPLCPAPTQPTPQLACSLHSISASAALPCITQYFCLFVYRKSPQFHTGVGSAKLILADLQGALQRQAQSHTVLVCPPFEKKAWSPGSVAYTYCKFMVGGRHDSQTGHPLDILFAILGKIPGHFKQLGAVDPKYK